MLVKAQLQRKALKQLKLEKTTNINMNFVKNCRVQ